MKNVADIWALTPMQDRILARKSLDATTPGSFVEQLHCRLTGPLWMSRATKRAWESVIARHALLRAAPAWQGLKKAVQVIRREVTPEWEQLDWARRRECSLVGTAARTDGRRASAGGLDLSKPPLIALSFGPSGGRRAPFPLDVSSPSSQWLVIGNRFAQSIPGLCAGARDGTGRDGFLLRTT